MGGPANALNISGIGLLYFDGVDTFSEIASTSLGAPLLSGVEGDLPSFSSSFNISDADSLATMNGRFGATRYDIFASQYSQYLPIIKYGEIAVGADGIYYLAAATVLAGVFYISFLGNGTIQTVTLFADAVEFDGVGDGLVQLTVLNNNSYAPGDNMTNFKIVKDDGDPAQKQWLQVTTLNGPNTGNNIEVIWMGVPNIGTSLTLNPGTPTTPVDVNTYGLYQTTDGLLSYRGGGFKIGPYTLPDIDGTSGQVLTTNGSGVVTWQDP